MHAEEKRDIVAELVKRLEAGIKVEGQYPETFNQNYFGYSIQQKVGNISVYLWVIGDMNEIEENIYMSILKVTNDVNDGQKEINCQDLKGKKVKLTPFGKKQMLSPYYEINGILTFKENQMSHT